MIEFIGTILDDSTYIIWRFVPDFAIAQTWQRLMSNNGKDIKPHDLTLLKHELLEID